MSVEQGAGKAGGGPIARLNSALTLLVLVCVIMLSCFAWSIWSSRTLQLQDANKDSANLARSLADHAEATVHMADIALVGLIERLEKDGTGPASVERITKVMAGRMRHMPRLGQMAIFDRAGQPLAGTRPIWVGNPSAEEWFTFHAAHPGNEAHIGPPVRDRLGPGWRLVVSRRFLDEAGEFAGVALATIELAYFDTLYRTFDVGVHGTILLIGTGGNLLVRARGTDDLTGLDFSKTKAFQSLRQMGPMGQVQINSPLDGISRQTSFREVGSYPMIILVALATEDVLAAWQSTSLRDGAVVMALVAFIALLGLRLARQMRTLSKAEAAIRTSEGKYRLLAESSKDVVVKLGADLSPTYVSPASRDVLGHTPAALTENHLRDFIHSADWPAVLQGLESIRGGLAPVSSVQFRFLKPDGTAQWVEASGRWLGEQDGFVLTLRDISRRVEAEQRLHAANNQLQKLVMLDGLTGIANRRCFDTVIEREFRRSHRDSSPLSVLLLDADRFKRFNDTYGHQAGDECLRKIACVLNETMRRPADLAARYGGEEFAILLPDTDEAGAVEIAERIRAAIHAIGILHTGNEAGVMTVSVGIATGIAGQWARTPADLLHAADAGLYRAKAAGRNRVMLPPMPDTVALTDHIAL